MKSTEDLFWKIVELTRLVREASRALDVLTSEIGAMLAEERHAQMALLFWQWRRRIDRSEEPN
jgi:hypothetical protein